MKINLHIVSDCFKDFHQYSNLPDNFKLNLETPGILTSVPDDVLEPSVLYIVRSSCIEENPKAFLGGSLLVVGEVRREILEKCSCAYVCLNNAQNFDEIINRVFEMLRKFNAWELSLLEAVSMRKTMQQIFDIAAEPLNNPIMLEEAWGMFVLSAGEFNDSAGISDWMDVLNCDNIDETNAASIAPKRAARIPSNKDSILTEYTGDGALRSRFAAQIHIGSSPCGTISLLEVNHKFTPGELSLVCYIRDFFTKCVRNGQLSFEQVNSIPSFLKQLIDGGFISSKALEVQLGRWGWKINDQYQIIHCHTPSGSREEDAQKDYVYTRARRTYPNAFIFKDEDGVAIIVRKSDYPGSEQHILDELRAAVTKTHSTCGVSYLFYDFRDVQKFYIQSKLAHHYGEMCRKDQNVFYYNEFSWEHLLSLVTLQDDIHSFLHPKAEMLAAYDKENHTDYLNTLLTYLHLGMNKTLTAKKLFIHRNTIIYRLENIKQLIGLDCEDESLSLNENFHLMLSCMALRWPSECNSDNE